MEKVIILGAGLIGKTIAADLCEDYNVTCADINWDALNELASLYPVSVKNCDMSKPDQLVELIGEFDLVIGAVPGWMGFNVLKNIVSAGKNVVDISFFPENALLLDELAKQNNVTAIVDCGVAPGLCNMWAGYHYHKTGIKKYECLVGGLPVIREWPYEYKAVFSPADVIEEYTRPARYVENGEMVTREALTDIEPVSFPETGTLESFNTDGLRSLSITMPDVPYMKEKTLRYPGHAQIMRILRETGFFDKSPLTIKGVDITPLDFTSKLLFPKWKLKKGEEDFTIMRVTIETELQTVIYTLFDRLDPVTQTSSMARTTGYTCTAAARMILEGFYNKPGISPPEFVGQDEKCMLYVMDHLHKRNVKYRVETIDANATAQS